MKNTMYDTEMVKVQGLPIGAWFDYDMRAYQIKFIDENQEIVCCCGDSLFDFDTTVRRCSDFKTYLLNGGNPD